MANETVQAVRQAEQKASKIEKDASAKAEAQVLDAYEKAKELVASMTKEAYAKAEKDLEQAQLQGAEYMKAALKKADKEILLLKEIVKSKEEAVMELVLSGII